MIYKNEFSFINEMEKKCLLIVLMRAKENDYESDSTTDPS